eukprot:scaffold2347_cov208-Alexandrium_tamarense.AAC.9
MGGFAFLGEVGRRKSSMLQNGGNHEKNCAEIVPYVWRAKSSSGDSMLCENDGKTKHCLTPLSFLSHQELS